MSICLLCKRPVWQHSLDTADICNCFIDSEPEPIMRCTICGFVLDLRYEAVMPTAQYDFRGRSEKGK